MRTTRQHGVATLADEMERSLSLWERAGVRAFETASATAISFRSRLSLLDPGFSRGDAAKQHVF
jgi:hypothetical protein